MANWRKRIKKSSQEDDQPIAPQAALSQDSNWRNRVKKTEEKPEIKPVSGSEALLLGAEQGLTLNHADEMKNALYQWLLKRSGQPEDPNYLNQIRNEYENAQNQHGNFYGGGQIGGAILPWMTGLGEGMTALQAGSVGGLTGILNRTGEQNVNPEDKSIKRAVVDHPIATAADVLIPAGMTKLANATRGGAEKIANEADYQAAKAMGAGPQEFLQTNVDKTLEMGRLGRQGKVVTPLANTEEMLSRADDLRNLSGQGQRDIYQTIDEQGNHLFNPQETAQSIEQQLSPTYRTPINKGEWSQLDNTIESVLARGENNIPLSEAQALKEEIGSVAYPRGRKPLSPTPKQEMAQDAYKIVRDDISKAASGNAGDLSGPLEETNKKYGLSSSMVNLLDKKLAKEQGGSLAKTLSKAIDLGSLAAAPFSGGASLKGLAIKKGAEGVAKYGRQTAATGLGFTSEVLSKMGKYQPLLEKAMKKGAQSLAATDFLLSKHDPEYTQMKNQILSEPPEEFDPDEFLNSEE